MPSRKARIRARKKIELYEKAKGIKKKGLFYNQTREVKIRLLEKIKVNRKLPKTPEVSRKIFGYLHQYGPPSYRYRSTAEILKEVGKPENIQKYKPSKAEKSISKIVDRVIAISGDATRIRERIKNNLIYKVISPIREVVKIANSVGARLAQNYVVIRKKGTQEVVGIVPATKTLEISAQKYEAEITETPPPEAPLIRFGRGGKITRVSPEPMKRPEIRPAPREGYDLESVLLSLPRLVKEPEVPPLSNPEFIAGVNEIIQNRKEEIKAELARRYAITGQSTDITDESLNFLNNDVEDILFNLGEVRRVIVRPLSEVLEVVFYQMDDGSWVKKEGQFTNEISSFPGAGEMNRSHLLYQLTKTGVLSTTREGILQNIRSFGYSEVYARNPLYDATTRIRLLTSDEDLFFLVKQVTNSTPEKPTGQTPENKVIWLFAVYVSGFDILNLE